MNTRAPANEDEARELYLYAITDAKLYKHAQAFIANTARRLRNKTYNGEKAVTLWAYFAEHAAKAYVKEFGPARFSVATRLLAAKDFRDHYFAEAEEQAMGEPPALPGEPTEIKATHFGWR